MNATQIQERINEIKSEPRALIGSDTGTHAMPTTYSIYEEINGERYAIKSHAHANGTKWTVEEAKDNTYGRIRMFRGEMARMSALRNSLRTLDGQAAHA